MLVATLGTDWVCHRTAEGGKAVWVMIATAGP
jgi:hypothetical protein